MDGRSSIRVLGLVLPGPATCLGAGWASTRAAGLAAGRAKALLARMLLNLSVDLLGGSVPVVGDIWDFFFRAHSRNLDLLRARRSARARWSPSPRTRLVVIGAAAVFLLALAVPGRCWCWSVSALRTPDCPAARPGRPAPGAGPPCAGTQTR
jgi:hypothetical protein